MEFLESLYEIENFGIYLFVIIGILVVLFLVVLFFGRKDQKARKSVENIEPKEEITKPKEETAFKEVSEPPVPVEVPVAEEPIVSNPVIFEPAQKEEVAPTTNVVLNSTFEASPQIETPSIEKEFDFDALADAISKELETIDKNTIPEQPKVEEPKLAKEEPVLPIEDNNFQIFEPVKMEPNIEPLEKEQKESPLEENKEVVKPRPSMPTVFSSVYVNREKEEVKPSAIIEPEPISVEKTSDNVMTPMKPTIDLPKMVDLPKKVEETPVVKPVIEEKKDDIIFPNMNN